jgi:hypothetical protein
VSIVNRIREARRNYILGRDKDIWYWYCDQYPELVKIVMEEENGKNTTIRYSKPIS